MKPTDEAGFKERAAKTGQSVVYHNSKYVRQDAEKLKTKWHDTMEIVRKSMVDAKD